MFTTIVFLINNGIHRKDLLEDIVEFISSYKASVYQLCEPQLLDI